MHRGRLSPHVDKWIFLLGSWGERQIFVPLEKYVLDSVPESCRAVDMPNVGAIGDAKDIQTETVRASDQKLVKNAKAAKLPWESCTYVWFEKDKHGHNVTFSDNSCKPIGMLGKLVDDFDMCGDHDNPQWQQIRTVIKDLYEWGAWKRGESRYAGIQVIQHPNKTITVDQVLYLETIPESASIHHEWLQGLLHGSELRRT